MLGLMLGLKGHFFKHKPLVINHLELFNVRSYGKTVRNKKNTFWILEPFFYKLTGNTTLNVMLRPMLKTPRRPVTLLTSAYFKRLR